MNLLTNNKVSKRAHVEIKQEPCIEDSGAKRMRGECTAPCISQLPARSLKSEGSLKILNDLLEISTKGIETSTTVSSHSTGSRVSQPTSPIRKINAESGVSKDSGDNLMVPSLGEVDSSNGEDYSCEIVTPEREHPPLNWRKHTMIFVAPHLEFDPIFTFPELRRIVKEIDEKSDLREPEAPKEETITDPEKSENTKKEKEDRQEVDIVRLDREVADALRATIRLNFSSVDTWILIDYLIMYPSIRDVDLADMCGLHLKQVRKGLAFLIRDHIIRTKIRTVRVKVTEEEAQKRTKRLPAHGMQLKRHTYYQLYPHLAANILRVKLKMMRTKLDSHTIDPDEAKLMPGVEIWYKCPYCRYILTNLHADIVLKAGALTGDSDDMDCPMCNTNMKRRYGASDEVNECRQILAKFNQKYLKILDALYVNPTINYPQNVLKLNFFEREDLGHCNYFCKKVKSRDSDILSLMWKKKRKSGKDDDNFKVAIGYMTKRKRLLTGMRELPEWFSVLTPVIEVEEDHLVEVKVSSDGLHTDGLECTEEYNDILDKIQNTNCYGIVVKEGDLLEHKQPERSTINMNDEINIPVDDITEETLQTLWEGGPNDYTHHDV
ncbi:hypothetical protein ACOME3_008885 [Neoechinorhynchus agilis]